MTEEPRCERERYWDELTTDADRIERLRGIVEQQRADIKSLKEQVERLNHHQHRDGGIAIIQQDLIEAFPLQHWRDFDYRVARGKP